MIDARAYVLRQTGEIPELENIQLSNQLSPGQVRLKVLYSGLCATQMEEIFVSSRNAKYMPHMFGHEGVGVVEAIGPGVETKQIGETCVIHWRQSSVGLDSEPGHYFANGQKINSGKVVTFSTQVVVPENRITRLPNNLSVLAGPVLGCSLSTGWGSVVRVGQMNSGDTVIVVGLGSVGTSAAHVASASGASKIIVIEPRGIEEDIRRIPNVVHLTDVNEDALRRELPRGSGTQVLALDTSGSSRVIELLVDSLPPRSRLVLIGMPNQGEKISVDTQKLLDGFRLTGSNGGDVDPGRDLTEIIRLSVSPTLADLTQDSNILGISSLRVAVGLQKGSGKKQILDLSNEKPNAMDWES